MALITTNLKVQFETTNTVVSPTLWVDEIAGIELTQLGAMSEPTLRTAEEGTPTGAAYFSFDSSNDGLGTVDLAGEDIPDGVEPRTMYVVVRFPPGTSAGNFNGVMYGAPTTRQAFGTVLSNTEKVLTDFWAASFASAANFNDDTWHIISITFNGSGVVGYVDNAGVISGTPATLNTILSKLYINYKLSDNAGALMDCAAVLIYAGAHTAPQLTEMFNYLNGKYITPGASGISERTASSGGTFGLTASPASVLLRAASSEGASGASAASVAVQGRAAISGGASGADAAPTRVSGRAGASGGLSGASASPVQIVTRSASGGGASGAIATPQTTGQVARSATCGGTSGASAAPVSVGSRAAASGGASGTGAMAAHVSVREAASGGLSGAEATPTAITQRAANAGGVSGVIAAPARIAARSAVSGGTSGSEATPADTSRVVDFRATALWDEPQFTALWDEPSFTALWDEPRFVATWRD